MKKKRKLDIIKTFEIFNMEALSILKDKFLEIVMIETENIFSSHRNNLFNIDFKKDNSVQITVINDSKTYDLLSNTWKRHNSRKKINGIKNEKNNQRNVHNQLNLS